MGRKNDLTNATLAAVRERSPEIAERLVSYYDHCCGCSTNCHVQTVYQFGDRKFAACHGKMLMNMNLQTFADFRFMIEA